MFQGRPNIVIMPKLMTLGMRILVCAGAFVILASCVLTPEELLERDRQACAGIGFSPDSEQFKNCLLQLKVARLHGHHADHR